MWRGKQTIIIFEEIKTRSHIEDSLTVYIWSNCSANTDLIFSFSRITNTLQRGEHTKQVCGVIAVDHTVVCWRYMTIWWWWIHSQPNVTQMVSRVLVFNRILLTQTQIWGFFLCSEEKCLVSALQLISLLGTIWIRNISEQKLNGCMGF